MVRLKMVKTTAVTGTPPGRKFRILELKVDNYHLSLDGDNCRPWIIFADSWTKKENSFGKCRVSWSF